MALPSISAYGGLYDRDYRSSEETSVNDISGAEMLVVIESLLFAKLKDDLEEAKLRCEDEEDDASIGEYMALEAVLKRCDKFIQTAIGMRYNKAQLADALKRSNFDSAQQYYGTRAYKRP